MSEYVFKLPDLGEGTVEAEIAEWMVKVGDVVAEEDPICAMLTDKAAVELTAPVGGRVISVAGDEGDTVAVGTPLIVFETAAAATQSVEGSTPAPTADQDAGTTAAPSAAPVKAEHVGAGGKVLTSPSIRARAREAGVDLAQVPGSGPRGRILKADFESYFAAGNAAPAAAKASAGQQQPAGSTEIKVIGLRRKIAERMASSAREIPHFSYVEEVDVTALESLRGHLNAKKSADEPKLTPLAFLALAVVRGTAPIPKV